jgi:hypothetical protein
VRRRPPSSGTSSTRRAFTPASVASGAIADSVALFVDVLAAGAGYCSAGAGSRESTKDYEEARCRALQDAIDQVTQRFEEAQQEYQGVIANSALWHKWKGEMIAYANVVALLEDLKSRAALVR